MSNDIDISEHPELAIALPKGSPEYEAFLERSNRYLEWCRLQDKEAQA